VVFGVDLGEGVGGDFSEIIVANSPTRMQVFVET
jgi:hypothetical protein